MLQLLKSIRKNVWIIWGHLQIDVRAACRQQRWWSRCRWTHPLWADDHWPCPGGRSCAAWDDAAHGTSPDRRDSATSPRACGDSDRRPPRSCGANACGTPDRWSCGSLYCTWHTHSERLAWRWTPVWVGWEWKESQPRRDSVAAEPRQRDVAVVQIPDRQHAGTLVVDLLVVTRDSTSRWDCVRCQHWQQEACRGAAASDDAAPAEPAWDSLPERRHWIDTLAESCDRQWDWQLARDWAVRWTHCRRCHCRCCLRCLCVAEELPPVG